MFWDGFSWVVGTRGKTYCEYGPDYNKITEKVTGVDKETNLKRVEQSRTVLIENIPLDLGLTSRELQRFFHAKLQELGFTQSQIQIVDCDVTASTTVAVEVTEQAMVDILKKLDGEVCLGERLKVRRKGEETIETNALAAVIALQALNMLTAGQKKVKTSKQNNDE